MKNVFKWLDINRKLGIIDANVYIVSKRNCVHIFNGIKQNEKKKDKLFSEIFVVVVIVVQNTRERWKMREIHIKIRNVGRQSSFTTSIPTGEMKQK